MLLIDLIKYHNLNLLMAVGLRSSALSELFPGTGSKLIANYV